VCNLAFSLNTIGGALNSEDGYDAFATDLGVKWASLKCTYVRKVGAYEGGVMLSCSLKCVYVHLWPYIF